MTLTQAMEMQPTWLQLWLNWLMIGGYILPLVLLFWRETRRVAIALIAAATVSALGVGWMFSQMGYVKLLGLPHILFWTPAVIYLAATLRRPLPNIARIVGLIVLATLLVSLAFDYTDVARWFLGERTPLALPAAT